MRKTFNTNDSTDIMIKELKEYFGSLTEAEAIRNAISFCYSKTTGKDYVQIQKERLKRVKPAVVKQDNEEKGERICERLGGKIKVNEATGQKFCEYSVFTKMAGGDDEESIQTTPLEDLNENHIINQYKD